MSKTTLDDIRQLVLDSAAQGDPTRPEVEAIAANDQELLAICDPAVIDAQRAEREAARIAQKQAYGRRTATLLAEQGEQPLIDAWVKDSPNHQASRRTWAEGKGRTAVLADAGRDEAQRAEKARRTR